MPQEKTGAFSGHGKGHQARHGTYSGYQMHILYKVPFPEDSGGEPCGCREANSDYKREARYTALGKPVPPRAGPYSPAPVTRRPVPVTFRPPPDDPGGHP